MVVLEEKWGRLKRMPHQTLDTLSCTIHDHTRAAFAKLIFPSGRFTGGLEGIGAKKPPLRGLGGPFSEVLGKREQTDLHFGLHDGPQPKSSEVMILLDVAKSRFNIYASLLSVSNSLLGAK